MLTFKKWLSQWLIDADHTPTEKEIDAMRDAWNGALEMIKDTAADFAAEYPEDESPS